MEPLVGVVGERSQLFVRMDSICVLFCFCKIYVGDYLTSRTLF